MEVNIGDILEDLQADMRPSDASTLSAKQLVEELQARGLKPTGFPEDDIKKLQAAFNAEFEAEKEQKIKERKEALLRRKAEEDAMRMQRFLEKQKREEEEALQADTQMAFFVDLLATNSTPPSMTLRAAPTAIRAFVKAIAATGNRSLRSLDLCGCGLADDVGVEIGACLKLNASLRRVDLDNNKLGPHTLSAIASALQTNKTLVSLSLEGNPITGTEDPAAHAGTTASDMSGVAALCEGLKHNASLTSLNLFHTNLTAAGGRLLVEAVEQQGSLADGGGSSSSSSSSSGAAKAAAATAPSFLEVLQLSPHDGILAADLARISAKLAQNARARIDAAEHAKKQRAEARQAAAADAEVAAKKAEEEAEAAWVEAERATRETARNAAEFEAYRRERLAALDRESEEKKRQARLKEEAAAKDKKAKK